MVCKTDVLQRSVVNCSVVCKTGVLQRSLINCSVVCTTLKVIIPVCCTTSLPQRSVVWSVRRVYYRGL